MCCQNPDQHPGRFIPQMPMVACGCGCIGREQPGWHLERYKEHLKAELALVEKRIQTIQDAKP